MEMKISTTFFIIYFKFKMVILVTYVYIFWGGMSLYSCTSCTYFSHMKNNFYVKNLFRKKSESCIWISLIVFSILYEIEAV